MSLHLQPVGRRESLWARVQNFGSSVFSQPTEWIARSMSQLEEDALQALKTAETKRELLKVKLDVATLETDNAPPHAAVEKERAEKQIERDLERVDREIARQKRKLDGVERKRAQRELGERFARERAEDAAVCEARNEVLACTKSFVANVTNAMNDWGLLREKWNQLCGLSYQNPRIADRHVLDNLETLVSLELARLAPIDKNDNLRAARVLPTAPPLQSADQQTPLLSKLESKFKYFDECFDRAELARLRKTADVSVQ